MTNLRGLWFGPWKLFDKIRGEEKLKKDNSGWEKINVKGDKGESNMWLRKKREVK